MSLLNDLTIVIPTHNRYKFLYQTLKVILDTAESEKLIFPKLIIMDSSKERQDEKTLQIIKALSANYIQINEGLFEKLYRATQIIETEKVIILADDDFLNINILDKIDDKILLNRNLVFPYIHFSESNLKKKKFSIKPAIDPFSNSDKNNFFEYGLSYFPTFYSLRKSYDFRVSFSQIRNINKIPPRLLEIYDCFASACLSGFAQTYYTPLFRRIHTSSMSSNDIKWSEILANSYINDLFVELSKDALNNQNCFHPSKKDFNNFLTGYLTSKQGALMTYSQGQIKNLDYSVHDQENVTEMIKFFGRINDVIEQNCI